MNDGIFPVFVGFLFGIVIGFMITASNIGNIYGLDKLKTYVEEQEAIIQCEETDGLWHNGSCYRPVDE